MKVPVTFIFFALVEPRFNPKLCDYQASYHYTTLFLH